MGHDPHAEDDFPDGGLRAWLVVLGVRSLLKIYRIVVDCIPVLMFSLCNVSKSLYHNHLLIAVTRN
jgi:hypothetical protein